MESTTATTNGHVEPALPSLARTLDIDLDPPVSSSNGQTYATLHLQEPTGKQVYAAELELKSNPPTVPEWRAFQIALLSQVSGINRDAIGNIPIGVLDEAIDFLNSIRRSVRRTGVT
jgi:hypothetical protein